ncbi:hypothetical protein NHN26_11595 [Rhodovulum tesquicola]|uniref:Type IV secretion system protein VirB7 n=2 Tax=Rhodovulum TaxID=34008 RepID=A0A844BQ65_9RHOB|nr:MULTISPECIES: hypothetical protein [Rhodovulum]MCO8145869.1 hypothetical protein [Rhodovulum tesquicola]MRH22107.1 hypothetical protein [Rhodovulum strictum]TCM85495.1 hypothetical protein EV216_10769 [Rhodovulum steppense]
MTRPIARSLALIGLISSLSACAQHHPAKANCFTFREAPAGVASKPSIAGTGGEVTRRASACDFVMPGTGG